MSITTNLTQLKINYLSQAQYDEALANNLINDNELYFISLNEGEETGYLLLAGGNVTGPVHFGDSVEIDELTVGDLIVKGLLSADTIDSGLFSGGPVSTTTITGNYGTTIRLAKRNGIVTLVCTANTSVWPKGSWNEIATIPEAYRPFCSSESSITFVAVDNTTQVAAKGFAECRINTAGTLSVYGFTDGPTNDELFFVVTYVGPVSNSDDSEAYIDIPNYQTSGSDDEALYNAITALGWQSNVIE